MKFLFFPILSLLIAEPDAQAAVTRSGTWRSTELKFSVGASAEAEAMSFPEPLSPQVDRSLYSFRGELNSSLKAGKSFLLKMRPTGRLDPANSSEDERSWADLPEGYLQLKGSLAESTTATLQAGFNTFTWGVTDGFNPVDVVNARRFNDPLRSEKLGAASLTGRLDFGTVLLEGIYIPKQRESRLPGEKSRWLPREYAGDVMTEGVLFHPPTQPEYRYVERKSYDNALTHNFGARVSSHLGGTDVALYGFDGAAALPATAYNLAGTTVKVDPPPVEINANPLIGLKTIYHRVVMTGASVVIPVSEILLKAEGAITKAYRRGSSAISERTSEAVLQLEHTFTGEKSSLTAIVLGTYVSSEEPSGTNTNNLSLSRMFDRAGALGLRWQPEEKLAVDGFTAADLLHGGMLIRFGGSYSLNDWAKLFGTIELFESKPGTPIGIYRRNDRGWLGLRMSI